MKECIICSIQLTPENTKPYRLKNYIHKCNECSDKEKLAWANKDRAIYKGKYKSASDACRKKLKENDPVRYSCIQMLGSSQKRANAYGYERDIDLEFLLSISPSKCPVMGITLKYGGGEKTKASCSLDRVDSTKGYTKDNVQIISAIANTMKSNADSDELRKFSLWVLGGGNCTAMANK